MERTRIPEPPFRCGFQPERDSYRDYVSHIRTCADRDCARRFTNHMLMQVYFARKYGQEGNGTIPANVEGYTANVGAPNNRKREDGVEAKARATGRADRTALGTQRDRSGPGS